MNNLFERGGLQQETGLLLPRALQEGSTPVSATDQSTGVGWETLYTVTTGKTLYVTQFIGANADADNRIMKLGSGSSGKLTIHLLAYDCVSCSLDTPIMFTSGTVVQTYFAAANQHSSIVGWEE